VLDTSVANVALPHIAAEPVGQRRRIHRGCLTAYLVANAIVLPLSGGSPRCSAKAVLHGRAWPVFTSVRCCAGIAPSLPLLILFRVMQGLGGGALQPHLAGHPRSKAIPREKQGVATAFYGMGVVVAPVIGPTLGGWMTDNFSWRWIFLINIPYGILSILLTTALIKDPAGLHPQNVQDRPEARLHRPGAPGHGLAALEDSARRRAA
jgi:DHA2 family multidrug resistance protein